jgi:ribosomal protein S1
VIAVNAEAVFFDIGYKSEGILPLAALQGETLKPGDKCLVTVKGRDLDGYYELSLFKVERPMDWTALEKAFADKTTVLGTVTGVIKGGFSVDVGCGRSCPLRAAEFAKRPTWRNWWGRRFAAASSSSTSPMRMSWWIAAPSPRKKNVPPRTSSIRR